jgi:murein DD-endopeptidase MepM/ murein hydrolase activator NlpD
LPKDPQMARRLWLLLTLALVLVLAGPAAADDIGQQKASVDAKLAQVQADLARSRAREAQLTTQIGSLTTSIRSLEGRVGDVSSRLAALQSDVALHRRRLAKLGELFRLQTDRLRALRREYALAVQRLDVRLVRIYEEGQPSTVDVVLAARSFDDVLSQLDYLGAIAAQDKRVAAEVAASKRNVAAARTRTRAARRTVTEETRVVEGRAQQVAILRSQLVANQDQLAGARLGKSHALAATRRQVQQEAAESQALAAASAQLAAQLRAAASASSTGGTTGGSSSAPAGAPHFIWPVSGPITSPFGMRWGTLHPGIDIGVPSGTPVHAAAAGTVVYCGWMSGYGNLVLIDHGGGYATAYGHNTSVAVSCGQEVAQGQVIAYSGCTGFCTGPHVHFEVRVNGTPVDPLGYL